MASKTHPSVLARALAASGCAAVWPDDADGIAIRRWNGALDPRPMLVVRCSNAGQASATLRLSAEAGWPVSVHAGGQDWLGRSLRDGSVVLDVSGMTKVAIDHRRRVATIAGGVTGGALNAAAADHGLVAVVGNDGATGMAGFSLGGGYGPLMTRFGLGCDNLLAAEVALVDGRIAWCDAEREPDLFWALRGGGGNFGVVTAMRVRLHDLGTVLAGTIVFPWPDARAALARFADAMLIAPADLFGAAILSVGSNGRAVVAISLTWCGEPARGEALIGKIAAVGTPLVVKSETMRADRLLSMTDGKLAQGRGYEVATRWFEYLGSDAIGTLIDGFDARTSPLSSIVFHHCHGAATDVAPDATAFGMRNPHFTGLIYAAWEPTFANADPHRAWARRLAADLAPSALPGGYASLLSDNRPDRVVHAFGPNAPRLRAAKARFDPGGVLGGLPLPLAEADA